MLLQHHTANNKQPKIKYDQYLDLEIEPKEPKSYAISPELEEELLSSRYFLKRRVWKNMDKIRRDDAKLSAPHREHRKIFKPHLPHHLPV